MYLSDNRISNKTRFSHMTERFITQNYFSTKKKYQFFFFFFFFIKVDIIFQVFYKQMFWLLNICGEVIQTNLKKENL